jgi:hypothetical protein
MTAKATPLGGQKSTVTAFAKNDRETWTSPKYIAAIVKNSIMDSAALCMANGVDLLMVDAFAITIFCDGEGQKADGLTHASQHLVPVWQKCADCALYGLWRHVELAQLRPTRV